jgi:hypothetical protein
MKMKEIKSICEACSGTGIYVGECEQDGSGVICYECKGTGCKILTYVPFTEKKVRQDIKRVYLSSNGFGISSNDVITKEKKTIHFSKFGCTYDEWLQGEKPLLIKELSCPHLLTGQEWEWIKCEHLYAGMLITDCPNYNKFKECWEEYDNVHNAKIKINFTNQQFNILTENNTKKIINLPFSVIEELLSNVFKEEENWYIIKEVIEPEEWTFGKLLNGKHYIEDYPLNEKGKLIIIDTNDEEEYIFDIESIKNGIYNTLINHYQLFNRIIFENIDIDDADSFFQLCFFGKIIYNN